MAATRIDADLCVQTGLFSPPATARFTARGNGAGISSYLMDTSIFDPLIHATEDRATVVEFAANEHKHASRALADDGVVVIRAAHDMHTSCASWTAQALEKLAPHLQTRDTEHPRVRHFDAFNGHAILHSQGRADIWPWAPNSFSIDHFKPMLDTVTTEPDLVFKSVGLLTVDTDCHTFGRWHRDVSPLFRLSPDPIENDRANVRLLPDYYFTLFIPLTPMDQLHSGGPEFVIGSHAHGVASYTDRPRASLLRSTDDRHLPVARPVCQPGDIIIMNGKVIHRGTPNLSNVRRDMMYAVFAPRWLDEEIM